MDVSCIHHQVTNSTFTATIRNAYAMDHGRTESSSRLLLIAIVHNILDFMSGAHIIYNIMKELIKQYLL